MKTSFLGTIFNGELQLDEAVPLANHCRVQVTVLPVAENQRCWAKALEALRELKATHPIASGLPPPRRDELYDRR